MVIPVLVPLFPFESLVHHVVAHCRVPYGGHPGLGTMPESEEVLGHGLVAPMALKAEPRNSDGNPDSPQVVVFLATIVDVTVGS